MSTKPGLFAHIAAARAERVEAEAGQPGLVVSAMAVIVIAVVGAVAVNIFLGEPAYTPAVRPEPARAYPAVVAHKDGDRDAYGCTNARDMSMTLGAGLGTCVSLEIGERVTILGADGGRHSFRIRRGDGQELWIYANFFEFGTEAPPSRFPEGSRVIVTGNATGCMFLNRSGRTTPGSDCRTFWRGEIATVDRHLHGHVLVLREGEAQIGYWIPEEAVKPERAP